MKWVSCEGQATSESEEEGQRRDEGRERGGGETWPGVKEKFAIKGIRTSKSAIVNNTTTKFVIESKRTTEFAIYWIIGPRNRIED